MCFREREREKKNTLLLWYRIQSKILCCIWLLCVFGLHQAGSVPHLPLSIIFEAVLKAVPHRFFFPFFSHIDDHRKDVCNWIPLLYNRDYHSTVHQRYLHKTLKKEKNQKGKKNKGSASSSKHVHHLNIMSPFLVIVRI